MPYNRKIFNINWKRLVRWETPVDWRTKSFMAWVNVFAYPFIDLYNRFQLYRSSVVYNISITPQVCRLEKALNDRYDISLRRIWIENAPERGALPLFRKDEVKPVKLFTKTELQHKVLYTKAETAMFTVDFIVYIPVHVAFDMNDLVAFLNVYKLLGKKFKVQIV